MSKHKRTYRLVRRFIKFIYENLPLKARELIQKSLPSKFAVPLYNMLPLAVPYSLHIDPTNLCNFRCTFCPTGDFELLESVNRPKGVMPFELFRKIIDELSEMCCESGQKVNELHLYKDGEPFINKELAKMAAYAKSKNVADSVQTTTNAVLMTKDRAIEIIDSGLDVIRISIEHITDDGYKSITRNFSNYNLVKENVRYLFEEKLRRNSSLIVKTKIVDIDFDKEIVDKYYNDFEHISDQISVNNLMGWSYSNIKDFTLGKKIKRGMGNAAKLREKIICPEPFRSLAINFNGKVSVCCVDWSLETVVGNINIKPLKEIWNGEQLREFRLLHLNSRKDKNKACASCHYLKGFPDHLNLDCRIEQLKKLYC